MVKQTQPSTAAQIRALLRAYWLQMVRNRRALIFRLILPLVTTIVAVVVSKVVPRMGDATGKVLNIPLSPIPMFIGSSTPIMPYIINPEGSVSDAWSRQGSGIRDVLNGILTGAGLKPNYTEYRQIGDIVEYERERINVIFNDRNAPEQLPDAGWTINTLPTADNGNALGYTVLYRDSNSPSKLSLPIMMNVLSTASQAGISGEGLPLRLQATYQTFPALNSDNSDIGAVLVPLLLSFGLSFTVVGATASLVLDRETGIRDHMIIMGLSTRVYLAANIIRDTILFMIPCSISLILLAATKVPVFIETNFAGFFFLILFTGPGFLLFAYNWSRLFNKAASAIAVTGIVISICNFLPYLIVQVALKDNVSNLANLLIGLFVPTYALFRGLRLLCMAASQFQGYTLQEVFSPDLPVLYLILAAIGHLALLALIWFVFDIRDRHAFKSAKLAKEEAADVTESAAISAKFRPDAEIEAEKDRLKRIASGELAHDPADAITASGINVSYPRGKGRFVVLRDLWFNVRRGEAYGYLGPNGAGKSTTLNVLTGMMAPTAGYASIYGQKVGRLGVIADSKRGKQLGVCQQRDVLYEDLTVKEHLELFAAIKGVTAFEMPEAISEATEATRLGDFTNNRSKTLSGGTKRRLSLAIALVGNPDVILCDEPTTGLDVATRRTIWKSIRHIKRRGDIALVLISHSMDEVEALCDRVGIVVNGAMRALGSPQQLMSNYGRSYKLLVRLRQPDTDGRAKASIQQMMQADNISCKLAKELGRNLEYEIGTAGELAAGILSRLFRRMEQAKESLGVVDYTASQPSLSQVFIEFARLQADR
ncbi:P-loop containing nucleoside triphosphate hydrolase protein [Ramicandelaber brevisporus]|nr:P-loop containing nucleoside triphosphate hydrolase protein [Ramicandelaber brevisporus]